MINVNVGSSEWSEGPKKEKKVVVHKNATSTWGTIYGMAMIGAAIYFIERAPTFWLGVWGLIKAIFWPATLMYTLLQWLKL